MLQPKAIKQYYLGCPIWGYKEWVGNLFTSDAKPAEYLYQYSRIFNTVEGNNTFYGLPKKDTVKRWQEAVPSTFSFSFKFPRQISHDLMLLHSDNEVKTFFEVMAPVLENVGTLFLQLPPAFAPSALPQLKTFLNRLPKEFQYAVEVRHSDFFDERENEKALDGLLAELGVNRALFDTGTLHQLKTSQPSILEAQRKKPRMPARLSTTADHPFLRFVGHNQFENNRSRLQILANEVANWIEAGKVPYVFLHSPDETFAPALCRGFHDLLKRAMPNPDVGEIPDDFGSDDKGGATQLSLF